MLITLEHAAQILTHSPDQVMFMVQSGDLLARIDEETIEWKFDIDEVLTLKAKLDEAKQLLKDAGNTVFVEK